MNGSPSTRTVVLPMNTSPSLPGGGGWNGPPIGMCAGTGFTYYTTKNKRLQQGKLELKKYDPVVRKHVVFKEMKMPPHSK